MKRLRNISERVQQQIVQDYCEHLPSGNFRYRLDEIAKKHEVCLSTVNNIARAAGCQGRPRGRKLDMPDARTLKLLRDATEPYISYAEVGRRNARMVINRVTGRAEPKPLTKQRVKQIIDFWRKRGNPGVRSRGFKPDQKIRWNNRVFTVLRYDNCREGAVREDSDRKVIDPFLWFYQGERSVRVDGRSSS